MAKRKSGKKIPASMTFHGEIVTAADPTLSKKLDTLIALVQSLVSQEIAMNQATQDALTALQAKVEKDTSVTQGAVTLLNGLSAQIAALKAGVEDPAVAQKIQELADSVGAQTQALADAVTANTPSA